MAFEATPEQLLLTADGWARLPALRAPVSPHLGVSLAAGPTPPIPRGIRTGVGTSCEPVPRTCAQEQLWPRAVLTRAASPSDTHLDTHPVDCDAGG